VKSKFQEDDCPEFCVHDYDFKMFIADIHEDLTVRKQAFLMTTADSRRLFRRSFDSFFFQFSIFFKRFIFTEKTYFTI
jgi:hypothetical protein